MATTKETSEIGNLVICEVSFNWNYLIEKSEKEVLLYTGCKEWVSLEYDGIYKLEVEGNDFQFYLNDQKMGGGNYKCQSWNDLRLYTSKQSKISIKNLKIKEK